MGSVLRVIGGYIAGCAFGVAAANAVLFGLDPTYVPKLEDITMIAWFIVLFGWSGLLFGIIAERIGIRAMMFFVVAGLLAAAIGILTVIIWGGLGVLRTEGLGPFLQQLTESIVGSRDIFIFAAPPGLAAGFGYWLTAGRYSGS